jgi:hypothetical protein
MFSAPALTWTNTYYLSRALVLTETNIQGTYDISTYDILEYIDIYKYIHGFADSCKYMMQHSYDVHRRAPRSTRIKVQIKGKAGSSLAASEPDMIPRASITPALGNSLVKLSATCFFNSTLTRVMMLSLTNSLSLNTRILMCLLRGFMGLLSIDE